MNKNTLKILIILSIIGIFNISYAKEVICPKGYICLPVNDPLIMASTSPCLIKAIGVRVDNDKMINNNKDQKQNIPYADGVSVYLENINQDHAGIWGVFGPGVGSAEGKKEDYGFKASITLSQTKTIKSITITNNGGNEGWSTSKDQSLFGKYPYPLVVIDENGKQLNNIYDQPFSIKEGKTTFRLYGQIEVPGLDRPEIVIIFTDNTKLIAPIAKTAPIISVNSNNRKVETNTAKAETNISFWARLKRYFGFN